MGFVVADISISLDGFVAGPGAGEDLPLGVGGEALHAWLDNPDERKLMDELFGSFGAVVAGRRAYDHTSGWGEEPPFNAPVFVPTRRPRNTRFAGGSTFTFVPDGVVSAVAQARLTAGDKNVYLMGGASTIDQALDSGLVDEVQVRIAPVLLGGGTRLFDLGARIELERLELVRGNATVHLRYRVVR